VRLGYPAMAKLGLVAIMLLVVGLVALIWLIVRRRYGLAAQRPPWNTSANSE